MRDGNQRVFSGWKVDRQDFGPLPEMRRSSWRRGLERRGDGEKVEVEMKEERKRERVKVS